MLLLAIVTISTILAGVIAFTLTPEYRVETVIAPVLEQSDLGPLGNIASQFGNLANLVGVGSNSGMDRNELIAMLTSKEFARDFIRTANLMPIMYADIWDPQEKKWLVSNPEEIPSEADAIKHFQEDILSVDEARRTTGLVTVAIQWRDRQLAADWANSYVKFANDRISKRVIDEATKSRDYLETELAKTSVVELQQSIYGLIQAQINRIMLANVRKQYAFKVIDEAFVPDRDQFVKPRRVVIVCLGFLFGAFLGVCVVLLKAALPGIRTVLSNAA